MIIRIFIILLVLVSCAASAEAAWDVVVVQSVDIRPYNETVKGFKESCTEAELRRIILADPNGDRDIKNLNRERPDMVLAVGPDALNRVAKIRHITIVYVLVLNPERAVEGRDDVTGINIKIGPEKQVETIRAVLPGIDNIGTLYEPKKSGDFIAKAMEASRATGLNVLAREIYAPRQFSRRLNNMRGAIDAFWMVPDTRVITPETMEYLLNFSLDNRVPIIAFSKKYIRFGALMSIGLDPYDIGAQAGEMGRTILSGVPPWDVPIEEPRKTMVEINMKMVDKFGVKVNTDVKGVFLKIHRADK